MSHYYGREVDARNQRIERLEAELAEATQRYRDADRRWDEQYAAISDELAEWEIHGVKVTVDCETCGGSGFKYPHHANHYGSTVPCPDCGGTGKKPRDGVEPLARNATYFWHDSTKRDGYFIPAEWLEAEK